MSVGGIQNYRLTQHVDECKAYSCVFDMMLPFCVEQMMTNLVMPIGLVSCTATISSFQKDQSTVAARLGRGFHA